MAGVNMHKLVRLVRKELLMVAALALSACASTDELFAQYESDFCPAPARLVENEVVRERVVIREVAAALPPPELSPTEAAKTLPWEPAVYFKSDSVRLTPVATQSLNGNLKLLNKFPRFKMSIRGFTDAHSSPNYNQVLAKRRISAVRDFLMARGVSNERVIGHSHGESIPLAVADSPIADEINRRVELMLLDEHGRPLPSRQSIVMGPAE